MPSRADVECLTDETVFQGHFQMRRLRLRHRRFDGGMSEMIEREVFHRGPVVIALPYDPGRDRVLLIEQFRSGPYLAGDTHPWTIEAVAGVMEPGETPENVARREALEEAGLEIGRIATVGIGYASPGGMSELMHLFVVEADLADAGGLHGLAEEGEDIRSWTEPFNTALARIATPQAHAAPLMTILYWLALNRDRLRADWGAIPAPPGAARSPAHR